MTYPLGTITEVFDPVVGVDPSRLALVTPAARLTYAEVDAAADRAAAALAELGVAPGDRVAVSLPNDVEVVAAFHGVMRLGAIYVGVNRALADGEVADVLGACAPAVFLAEDERADRHRGTCRTIPLGTSAATAGRSWRDATGAVSPVRFPAPDQDAPAAIAFTSGTTGRPKGVVHSQRGLLLPAAALVTGRGYDSSLRKGDCLPLTILNMQVLTTLVTARAGGCCLLTDRRDARGVAEWIHREEVNVWNGVPAQLYDLVHDDHIDPELLRPLRDLWSGGGPCPEELRDAVATRFGLRVHQTYGLTEAPTVVTIEEVGAPNVAGSSGTPLGHVEVVVLDGAGRQVSTGELGEITVRASRIGPFAGMYHPTLGYWEEGSVRALGSSELGTGDIGYLDAGGNLHVHDRKNLMILRGGANVYPAEVERVIQSLPGVRACAVLGLADARLGETVAAVVEIEAGCGLSGDDVTRHCRGLLARYKVPERVVLVDSLARNAMGKIARQSLAALFD